MSSFISNPTALGRALRDARRASGRTQSDVSRAAGIQQPTLSMIERGVSKASLGTLLRLLAVLDLELVLRPRDRSGPQVPWED